MSSNGTLKVGSKIVELGNVYIIFKVEKVIADEKTDRVIHYRPYFKNSFNETIVCTIPERSIVPPDIREPESRKAIREMLIYLSGRPEIVDDLDVIKAKTTLNTNILLDSARILRRSYKLKKARGDELSKNKRDVVGLAMSRVVEEVAIVYGMSLEQAERKITSALDK